MSNALIGEIGLGSNVAGGIFSAFGAGKQARAQKSQADYQAQVATLRAQIDKQNAEYAIQQGEQQSVIAGIRGGQILGQIKASQAASGLDIRSGSAAQVQQSQRLVTRMDLDQIRSNAAKTAYDFDVQSAFDKAQAGLYQAVGADAMQAGQINIASSVLGTAGSVSSKWLQGQQLGLWGTP